MQLLEEGLCPQLPEDVLGLLRRDGIWTIGAALQDETQFARSNIQASARQGSMAPR